MTNSKITDFTNAIINKINNLILKHDINNSAHADLFNIKANVNDVNTELSNVRNEFIELLSVVLPKTRSVTNLLEYRLDESEYPTFMEHSASHNVYYDESTNQTVINITPPGSGNKIYRFGMKSPVISKNIKLSIDFMTTGMGNDDFHINLIDSGYSNYPQDTQGIYAWIITGQGRQAYGYRKTGASNGSSVNYADNRSGPRNNVWLHYEMTLTDDTVSYLLKTSNGSTTYFDGTYTRQDGCDFTGVWLLSIGGGNFSTGSTNINIYIKDITLESI